MLAIQATARIGGLGLRLCGRPRQRYYFLAEHRDAPQVTAIAFLGHNKDEATRKFEVRVENAVARRAAEEMECA